MMRRLLTAIAAASLLFAAPAFAESSFAPLDNSTVSISVSTSSQSVQVSDHAGAQQVRIANVGTATVFIRAGCSGVTATTSNLPIPTGDVEVLTFNTTCALNIAAIAAGSTGNVYFTPGSGI